MRFAVLPLVRITKLTVREPTNHVASLKNWLKLKKTENQGLVFDWAAVQLLCSVKSVHFKVTERQARTSVSPLGRVPDGGGWWESFPRTEESMQRHMTLLSDCVCVSLTSGMWKLGTYYWEKMDLFRLQVCCYTSKCTVVLHCMLTQWDRIHRLYWFMKKVMHIEIKQDQTDLTWDSWYCWFKKVWTSDWLTAKN